MGIGLRHRSWGCSFLLVLVISLGLGGCDGLPSQVDNSPEVVAFFPQHDEPLVSDRGGEYLFGELILRDGCLRLDYSNSDVPDYTLLLVWPPGLSVRVDDDSIRVIDSAGLVVAHAGDDVRLSGRLITRDVLFLADRDRPVSEWPQRWRRQLEEWQEEEREWQQRFSVECPGPFLIVGDEVSVVGPDEPTMVSAPGSTVFLVREKSRRGPQDFIAVRNAPHELVLDGDCLRLRREGHDHPGHLVSWPAGFTPHIADGEVEIRNGGGRTVARVGDMVEPVGGVVSDDNHYSARCPGRLFHAPVIINLTRPFRAPARPLKVPERVEATCVFVVADRDQDG